MSYLIHQGFRSVVFDAVRSLSVCLLAGVLVSAIRAQEPPAAENTFDPDDVVTVVFEIGDPSGSHSERWAMNVTGGPVALRPQSPEYGVVNTLTINQFRKGKSYRAMVDHLGTDPSLNMDEPDYDYQATVTSQSVGYYIKDPSQLLGEDGSSTFNGAAGKTATFGFPKPQIDFKDKDGNVITKPAKADPGVFIRVNDDDSNADGEIDRLHPYGALDPQMREVTLRMKLEGDTLDTGTVTLEMEGAGTVRLWDPADWTTPITLPKSWNLAVPAERAALPLDKTLYVEALTPGAQARDTLLRFKYTGTAAGSGSTDDEVNMSLFLATLAVDYDRDGTITLNTATTLSPDATTQERPFRFWSNDDDDNPESDAAPEKDYTNSNVDGFEDLADFLPVYLDIKKLLEVLPPTVATYKLKQADGALNFVYTSLTRETAFDYEFGGEESYGPGVDEPAISATTQQITAEGVPLTADFLNRIKDQDQGVILVEARQVSGAPLKLVVEKGGVEVTEVILNLASLRLYADPGKVHLGFDPPNKSEPEDLAAPSTYWASVVQGTASTILKLDLPASALAGVQWKIAAADTSRVDISPKTFTSATTDLTITGLSTESNAPEEATLSLVPTGSNGPAILTLKVLVLPRREMGLAVYVLEDPDAPLTQFASSPVVPLPNSAEILAVVNDSMKQAGVHFSLHPSSGTYSFPYDTRGFNKVGGVDRYSVAAEPRAADGRMSIEERIALFQGYRDEDLIVHPAPADEVLPVSGNDPNNRRIILVKESGIPYSDAEGEPLNYMLRGLSDVIVLFVRNLPQQVPVAAAHEVGHTLGSPQGLSTANEDGGHDQPPFSYAVTTDQPNNVPPAHPGNELYQHKPEPNRALMQSGTPEPAGLPWVYGRWMRNEDWELANRGAGGIEND